MSAMNERFSKSALEVRFLEPTPASLDLTGPWYITGTLYF